MRISVFGLGYVGSVSAGCLAALGHEVVGVDVNAQKVATINEGRSPIVEPGLEDLIARGVEADRIRATASAGEAIEATDLSMICVGTPSASDGSLDLAHVHRVSQDIGRALAGKDRYHVVVLRSTVLPGSTEEQVIPVLEQASGKRVGHDVGIAFNPEFLREGAGVKDFFQPPYVLIGQHEPAAAETVAKVYSGIEAPLRIMPLRVTETVKYVSNAFHALKVSFANEIGTICKRQGIDSHEVMEIFFMDAALNLGPAYLKPGFAFGGPCLPKDLRALLSYGRRMDLRLPVLEAILPSNELQIQRGLELIERAGSKRVGLLGLSFKAGTDDLRESPLVSLIQRLIDKGYQVKVYDRSVCLADLHGTNLAYIEQADLRIVDLVCDSVQTLLDECDTIVIGKREPEGQQVLQEARPDQTIVDLVRIAKRIESTAASYQGIGW